MAMATTAARAATETADTEAMDRALLLQVLVELPVIWSTSVLPASKQNCDNAIAVS